MTTPIEPASDRNVEDWEKTADIYTNGSMIAMLIARIRLLESDLDKTIEENKFLDGLREAAALREASITEAELQAATTALIIEAEEHASYQDCARAALVAARSSRRKPNE